jgi:predicted transcriptional regulator
MQNRSKEEILANMLEAALFPIKKTAILYKANLSYTQLKLYLSFLERKGLIQSRNGWWIATEKGKDFVSSYKMIIKLIKSEIPVIAKPPVKSLIHTAKRKATIECPTSIEP